MIEILLGIPIVVLSTYASTSPSTIATSGVNVYPLPGLSTTTEKISPFLTTTLKVAFTPSPLVMITFGFE